EVQRTISFIRDYPDAGAAIRLPVRRALVDRFPYAINLPPRSRVNSCSRSRTFASATQLLAPATNGALTFHSPDASPSGADAPSVVAPVSWASQHVRHPATLIKRRARHAYKHRPASPGAPCTGRKDLSGVPQR